MDNQELIKTRLDNILLVPYNTIDGHGLLKCFKPKKLFIYGIGIRRNVLIGLTDDIKIDGVDCILGQKVIERI